MRRRVPGHRGRLHRYRAFTYLGSERTLYGFTFDAATFFGRRWRTQVFLYDDEDLTTQIASLAERVQGVTLQQTRGGAPSSSGAGGATGCGCSGATSTSTSATRASRPGGISPATGQVSATPSSATRDSLTEPHRGLFWSLGGDLGLRALGPDVDFVRLYGQIFAYVPLGPRVVWAQGLRPGAVPGNDPLYLLDSAGAGLRLMFRFGPVRLDWGYILDPKPGEKRWRWVVTLGQAF